MLLSEDDLHVRSSTSSELVVGLNLRPGFVALWYQTPSVLLNIKEFLLSLSSAWVEKPSDVCHACRRTIPPTGWFSTFGPVGTCRVGLVRPPVGGPPRGHVLGCAAHQDSIIKSAWAEEQ